MIQRTLGEKWLPGYFEGGGFWPGLARLQTSPGETGRELGRPPHQDAA